MFRAIVHEFGPARDVVRVERHEPLAAGPGQVRVRMLLASINPSDLVTISGAYRTRTTLPFMPGFEGVGIVETVGPGVPESLVGRRVLPLGSAGAWQNVKITEEKWCFPVPEDFTDEQAALSYVNPMSAWMMVRDHAPSVQAPVVVNAATSAIGRMLIRMLNRRGVKPIALVRRPAAEQELRRHQLEVSSVLCTTEPGLTQKLRQLSSGCGISVAWDAVGGDEGNNVVRALCPGGTLVLYGLLSGQPLSPQIYIECPKARIVLFRLRDWVHSADRRALQAALNEVFNLVRDGTASTDVAAVFPLLRIQDAIKCEATPGRKGKVLLSLRDGQETEA